MIRLVINADDFGYATSQTEAILECFRLGIQTSTTVMVTMPDFERATDRAREEHVIDRIGLHLNFTEGVPLTDPIRHIPIFCNKDGVFSRIFHKSLFHRMFLTSEAKVAVAKEVEAQMRKYLSAGYTLMHLDSHHHTHTDPAMVEVILPIAKSFGFRTIRMSRNLPRDGYGIAKKVYKWCCNNQIARSGLSHTDYFGSVVDLSMAIDMIPNDCTVEVMTHPSRTKDGQFVASGGELMDMGNPMASVKRMLKDMNQKVKLVTYAEI